MNGYQMRITIETPPCRKPSALSAAEELVESFRDGEWRRIQLDKDADLQSLSNAIRNAAKKKGLRVELRAFKQDRALFARVVIEE